MIDLQNIYQECVRECRDAGIPIRDDRVTAVDFMEKEIAGAQGVCLCNRETAELLIAISNRFSTEPCPIEALREVIIHELIHTCSRCWGHGKTWRKYARIMNERYGYELMTAKDNDAIFHKEMPILHRFVCKNCGSLFNLRKEDEGLRNPHVYYVCPYCNSRYEEIGQNTPQNG